MPITESQWAELTDTEQEYWQKVKTRSTELETLWNDRENVPETTWQAVLMELKAKTTPRPIPGSEKVMFSGSGHHNAFHGSIGIIDPGKGLNYPDGLSKATPDVSWPECGDGPSEKSASDYYHKSGSYMQYLTPYPLRKIFSFPPSEMEN
ncbi:MAG: hypothetical protein Q4C70_02645 [Planctomycetia bacterium]|nr:hypothetical protein [Planctomycetia bacterium]